MLIVLCFLEALENAEVIRYIRGVLAQGRCRASLRTEYLTNVQGTPSGIRLNHTGESHITRTRRHDWRSLLSDASVLYPRLVVLGHLRVQHATSNKIGRHSDL